ncbi:MAG: hypothetical protein GX556_06580 [Fibrobacter sp.]|nr:hypothetical protein [Fibrobacter sp.]
MDIHSKKILSFLKRNSNLDLEVPDIAFHLKLDENFVQNFLNSLYQKGFVTAKQNKQGRVYWYAVEEPPREEPDVAVEKTPEKISNSDDFDTLTEGGGGIPVMKVFAVLILIAVLGGGVILGGRYFDKKISSVTTTATKNLVPRNEFTPFKDTALVKIGNIQTEVKTLYATIDSLKKVLASIDSIAKSEEKKPEVKKTVKRRR